MPDTPGSSDPRRGEAAHETLGDDPRLAAFLAPTQPGIFHAVSYHNDIGKADPFDVETIHAEARAVFRGLVDRASDRSGPSAGRILLLLGEAGSGKTHLMRAFRNATHAEGRGYCGYLQMTSATEHYGRYLLNNLIDSLDQPYDERAGETSGLMRISTAVAESPRGISLDRLEPIRGGTLDLGCLAKLIDALADQVVWDDRFNNVDIDLVRALLFLQSNDPRIKARVLKYLRCEPLTGRDSDVLGGIIPRTYDDAPQRVIRRLGELMAALESAPLILCVDQLEDIYSLDDAPARFRRAVATLCDLVSRIPTAIVVLSCLEDFYDAMNGDLTRSFRDRIENDPRPVVLKGTRDRAEIEQLLGRRLRALDEALGVPFRDDDPTYPFPSAFLDAMVGLSTREVLIRCQEYRERCITSGTLLVPDGAPPVAPVPRADDRTTGLEQAWNDERAAFAADFPADDAQLAALLAEAIRACSDESQDGTWFEAEVEGRLIPVECHAPDDRVARLLVAVCNAGAQGGYLGRQVAEVEARAGEHPAVIVRSTEFPSSPAAAVTKQLAALAARGGRRVVVEDGDWRAMFALPRFRAKHRDDSRFAAWLRAAKPLSRLRSIRAILDLDRTLAVRFGGGPPSRTAPGS